MNVIFDDDTTLNSLDVALSTENKKLEVLCVKFVNLLIVMENFQKFKPIIANFADNVITRIQRVSILYTAVHVCIFVQLR